MPPKKESKKSELKKIEKVIDDRTFGLKNKNKSKTVQSFIKGVATQVKQGVVKGGESKRLADEYAEKAAKKKEEEKQQLLNSLFKSVKRSHDEDGSNSEDEEEVIEESGEIDLYVDQRDQIYGRDEEDEEEEEVDPKKKKRTEKICKFFLDAVEANKYGWRWNCPNGRECIYQHKLPLGFVLKREGNNVVIEDLTPLEEKLEEERSQLTGGTPVTLERFLRWKEEKKLKREKEWEEKRLAEAKKTGTKGLSVLSGRALFKYDPTLFQDDLDAAAVDDYEEEKIEEEEEKREDDGEDEGDENEEGEGENERGEEEGEKAPEEENNEPGQVENTEGEKTEVDPQAITKKKKKKKKAAKKAAEEDNEVQINENVFLEQDVELPEDD